MNGTRPRPAARAGLALLVAIVPAGLLAPASGVRAGDPPPAPAPYRLVQRDGTVVVLAAPPKEKGSLLVGTLHPSGRLVSFPKASLDPARTAEENRNVPPPPPPPKPTTKVLDDGRTPLGTSHPLQRTAAEAQRVLESARKGERDDEPSPARASAAAARDAKAGADEAGEEPRDLTGRTEAWWRTHAGARRRDLDEATYRLRVAEAALEAAERDDLLPGDAQRRTFVVRVLEARQAAETARADEARARKRWDELQEDARKSGTPPGWLR